MEENKQAIVKEEVKQTKVFGILSLVLSGASIFGIIPVVGAIAGIIFGSLSKRTTGEKLGQAGILVSIICFGLYAVELLMGSITSIVAVLFIVFMMLALIMGEVY